MNSYKLAQYSKWFILSFALFFSATNVRAQLSVTMSPIKVTGQKAIVQLKMKNNFNQNIESARAACFLFDDQGKMVGQSAKWVIGGTKDKVPLPPAKETTFNFVITANHPFTTTNLTTKVQFNQVLLKDGKLADITKDVQIQTVSK